MIAVLPRRFKRLGIDACASVLSGFGSAGRRFRLSPARACRMVAGVSQTAEVLIVGAGIMGVSTAYHLARLGVGPVVVLERDTVCSG